MSKETVYQEGVITLSNGLQIPFLCKSFIGGLTEEERKGIAVKDIEFFPEVDRKDELAEEVESSMKSQLDKMPQPSQEKLQETPDKDWGDSELDWDKDKSPY